MLRALDYLENKRQQPKGNGKDARFVKWLRSSSSKFFKPNPLPIYEPGFVTLTLT
jgi:hypothetical protein